MAQPFPPTGGQQQQTERPLKVYTEQYRTGIAPLPAGAQIDKHTFQDERPFVRAGGFVYELHDTDWIVTNRYTGQPIEVISDEEHTERFGAGGGPN